jgi:hypothetical protein
MLFMSAGVLTFLGYEGAVLPVLPALLALFWFKAVFVIWLWRR